MKIFYIIGATALLFPIDMKSQDLCTPHDQVENLSTNGGVLVAVNDFSVANDFFISSNNSTFTAQSMTLMIDSQSSIEFVSLKFYEDNNGHVGNEITENAISGLVPTSQEVIEQWPDFNVIYVILDFPSNIIFQVAQAIG